MEPAAKDQGSAFADRLAGLEASLLDHPLRARIAAELSPSGQSSGQPMAEASSRELDRQPG